MSKSCRQVLSTIAFAVAVSSAAAQGQPQLNAEASAQLRTAALADLETVQGKLLGLAEAFPQELYSWRPMEGVRSVSEVLVLTVFENYAFIPSSFGATARDNGGPAGIARIRALSDKTQLIAELKSAFAYAKSQLSSADLERLGSPKELFGTERTAASISLIVMGDLHEHLGQLIAYARMNKIVPPWSK